MPDFFTAGKRVEQWFSGSLAVLLSLAFSAWGKNAVMF
jgi:hypothetical protein